MEKIKLCDEGATLLAEAILETCREDYKYCWLIKKKRKGGQWIFTSPIPREGNPNHKFINPGLHVPLIGSVDDNIRQMEKYIRGHQTLCEISEEIIKHLRNEAESDKKLIKKVKELKYVQIRNETEGFCPDVPAERGLCRKTG